MRPKRGKNQYKSRNYQNVNSNRSREYRHYDQLSEKDVGITDYIGNLEGFCGVIKARYSDFQVNEIDLDGNIVKLTDTNIPKDFSLSMKIYDYNAVINSPNENIPQEIWVAIKALVNNSGNSQPVILNIENLDKAARTEIHSCIKKHFGQKVITSTIQLEGKRQMQFKKFNKEVKNDARFKWPEDRGEYVYFVVYKEKMDTLEATFKISSALNMNPSKFSHAGNKDRRSITSQWFCVKKVEPWKLINKTRHIHNIRIGNLKFMDVPLKLGQLKGNKFRIALRNVTGSEEIINAALAHLKEHGFINYYGLQRFGNDKDVPTYQVGISLLQGKWKDAIDKILKPKLSDDPLSNHSDIIEAKKIYSETGNAAKAYSMLQRNKSIAVEAKLLEGLKGCAEHDYVSALEKVPRSVRLLYLHAFQSLIWNKMVSKRIQIYGMKPVAGDLVYVDAENELTEEADNGISEEDTEPEEIHKKEIKVLTEDDLDQYSMYDVVLPLPGYDVTYPVHMKDIYKETMEEYGIDLAMTKQTVKTYNLSGNYRKILQKVEDFSWSIVKYNNYTDNLILSDLQELKGETLVQTSENGQYKAVIVEFTLPACSYATMLLRQVMKIETATGVQSKMNEYHKLNKNKISSEDCTTEEKNEDEEMSSSLLTNPDKYEMFKNSIFNSVSEISKRKNESTDGEEGPSKKQKIEETSIKPDVS